MSLSAVQNVSFKGNCENCQKKTGGAVPLVASMAVPGLGQYIDGRGQEGKKFFLRGVGAGIVAGIGSVISALAINKEIMSEELTKGASALTKAGKLGGLAVMTAGLIYGVVNHYKNLKDAYQGDKNINVQA